MSREASSRHSTTPNTRPVTPSPDRESPGPSRSTSQLASERRPMGPRCPSPLPKSPLLLPSEMPDVDFEKDDMFMHVDQPSTPPNAPVATHYGGFRAPFVSTGNTANTPKQSTSDITTPHTEPLSIKKKTSGRSNLSYGSPLPMRKTFTRTSPAARSRIVSPRRVSPQVRTMRVSTQGNEKSTYIEETIRLAETTKEDVRIMFYIL